MIAWTESPVTTLSPQEVADPIPRQARSPSAETGDGNETEAELLSGADNNWQAG